ncbi:hypothetical protein N9118_11835 [Akkermansiaceae bacterium]|nr:hypothetical protein [Akkermansiaceae bacterium]
MRSTFHEIRKLQDLFPKRSLRQPGRTALVAATVLLSAVTTPESVQAADPLLELMT